MKITIQSITAKDTYILRQDILRKNIDKPFQFIGDFDATTYHIGAFNEQNQIIGIVSLMKISTNLISSKKQYQLRGMAISERFQKQGIGQQLIENAIVLLKNKRVDVVWCNARKIALLFYLKQGFKQIGNPFSIPKIGTHFLMSLDIT